MLNAGDIAIIGFRADNPDQFTFVALAEIAAGEVIRFTDNGVRTDGSFRANEGTLAWTAPLGGIAAGTIVGFEGNADFTVVAGGFALSTDGDQVIAYQDDAGGPKFLFAVQSNSTLFQADATTSNTSALPPGLTLGQTAIAVGEGAGEADEFDNVYYSGPLTGGSRADLLAAIADPVNWTGDNAGYAPKSEAFVVTGDAPAFDLQITEIWPGNADGANLTEDWFEVTNTGTAAWTAASDGDLFFDDESRAAGEADRLAGIATIAAGETVIFVNDTATADFRAVWGSAIDLTGVQIGTYDGAGLGQGGDGVALFIDGGTSGDTVLTAGTELDFEAFSDANAVEGASWDVVGAAFSADGVDGAVTTVTVNDQGQPAVGSPGNGAAIAAPAAAFTLELLHFSDQEASTGAISDAPNMSAVLAALRAQDIGNDGAVDNTITVSSGDAYIPGVFLDASIEAFRNGGTPGTRGVADVQIQNELGVQAITFGNHEFDLGTALVRDLITGAANGTFDATEFAGTDLAGTEFAGADYIYLSSNIDFQTDPNLAPLEVPGGRAPLAGKVSSSTVLDVNGEMIGIVGATTPTLRSISSPGSLQLTPVPFDGVPTPEQIDALAAVIQIEVDALLAANPGMNKVILMAHMQRIDIEFALAERLTDVDVIIAGGSHIRLLDDDDRLRAGDSDQGQYPRFFTNPDGKSVAVVNTDGNYKYVGRLVIDFDADGNIIPTSYDEGVSGAYATDDQGVTDLGAEALIDPEIQAIVDQIEQEIVRTESNVFGFSDVFLNGNRSGTASPSDPDGLRTQETNLGNLTADANLAAARLIDATTLVSIKNGGGIRNSIGEIVVLGGETSAVRLANPELVNGDGDVVKGAGGISQTDIAKALSFNNDLSLVTLTVDQLVNVLEHGVSGLPGVAGAFPQLSGIRFSYDDELPAGARIVNAGIFDENGDLVAELVRDGVRSTATDSFRVVTLRFLLEGGDSYVFPSDAAANRVDLASGETATTRSGDAVFANDGTEQDALAEYLNDAFSVIAYNEADTGRAGDTRIQDVDFAADTIFSTPPVISILISEIMYNPASAEDDWEWVEIANTGTADVNLAGWVIDDINTTALTAVNIAAGVIEAGGRAVLFNADAVSAAEFAAAWGPGINLIAVTGWSALGLGNGGDTVSLWTDFASYLGDNTVHANAADTVAYDDSAPWPVDNNAASIHLTDLSADNANGANWALSTAGAVTPAGTGRVSAAAGGNAGGDIGSPDADTIGIPAAPAPVGAAVLTANLLSTAALGGAEIVAYDSLGQRAFVTSASGLQVLDISDPAAPVALPTILPSAQGYPDAITSVAVYGMLVAIAVPASTITDPGSVLFYDTEGTFLGALQVGALPDMLTFDATGNYLLVANEAQSSDSDNAPDAAVNPAGSVSVIAINGADIDASTVTDVGFTGLNDSGDALKAKGIRLNDAAPSVAADFEPEYITITGTTAYISLQESNAYAVIADITAPADFGIDDILPAGTVDHSVIGNGIDASDRDDGVNIVTSRVTGLRMPDAVSSFNIGGMTYFASANEGDDRGVDVGRAGSVTIDAALTDLVADADNDAVLGRINVSLIDGDTDGDGDFDQLFTIGTRTFTIYDEAGNVVFDSGDLLERIVAAETPDLFNADEANPDDFDTRSDNKGPEPEAVTFGVVGGVPYLFVGLERAGGGVVVFDITDPANPVYDQYIRVAGDIAPEGLRFIAADDSPTGAAILAIANEVSNTLSLIELETPPAAPFTLISEIQGVTDYTGRSALARVGVDDVSALSGQTVTIQAIVTADFQAGANGTATSNLRGFFVQEETVDYDDNAFSSEGLFIFDGNFAAPNVAVGDLVTITGTVSEFGGTTQLTASEIIVVSGGNTPPPTVEVTFPTTGVMLDTAGGYVADLEHVEGMIVTVPTVMSVTEMFNLDRFGEYLVSSDGRLEQYTQNNAPSVAGNDAHLRDLAARSVMLDDGLTSQNPASLEIIDGNNGVLDAADSFRMGDTITGITGVVNYAFNEFRVQDATGDYAQDNPRPASPQPLPGNFSVATLNVLNYFTTLDTAGTGPFNSGPANTLEPRGANTPAEFERQYIKLVNAIVEMDADVLGLIEIENDDDIAVADLVARVNTALGSDVYDYVATGDLGGDAIAQAFIYKTGTTELVGDFAALTTFDGRDFLNPLGAAGPQNRPALAQTFRDSFSGETVTIAVNHLKSKGSLSGLQADNDQGDGQGNNNATRTAAADILADWLATDPTGQGSANVLIVGDLNSYAQEDPIEVLTAAGYTDLGYEFDGADSVSYVFDGQTGTLDYALANAALRDKVGGVTHWNVNADEADAIDYNLDFGRAANLFDAATAARNSDHDPVIISFQFDRDVYVGSTGNDVLSGSGKNDIFVGNGGGNDLIRGLGGDDSFDMAALLTNGRRDTLRIVDFEAGETLFGIDASDIAQVRIRGDQVSLLLTSDRDVVTLDGIDSFDQINFADTLLT